MLSERISFSSSVQKAFSILSLCLIFLTTDSTVSVWAAPPQDKEWAEQWAEVQLTQQEKNWLQKKHTIRVRTAYWPPFQLWEKGPQGISVEYLKAIAEHVELDLRFHKAKAPWHEALKDLESHKTMDMMLTISRTPEREQFVAFTDDYLSLPWVIFTRDDEQYVGGIQDLYGKTVVVQQGFVMHKKLRANYPQIQLMVVGKTEKCLVALSTGQCDAFIGNLAVGTYISQQNGIPNIKVAAPTPFKAHTLAMGVRKDWPELASILNKYLHAMPQQQRNRINQSWLAMRYDYGIEWEKLLYWGSAAAGLALAIIGIFIFANRRLKKAQDELIKYERIVSAAPDILLLVDEAGSYVMANEAAQRFMSPGQDQNIVGKSSANLLGEDFFRSVTLPNLEKALGGEISTASSWVKLANAGRRYLELTYYPVPDMQGNISLVAISARDQTSQQQAQEDRQRIFEMSMDMLCIADMDGYFKEVNPAWEKTLGWSKEELLASRWISFVHPDDVEATTAATKQLMSGQKVIDFVNRYQNKDGSYHYLSWNSQPDHKTKSIYAVARDASERIAMERLLKEQAATDPLTGAGNRRLFMDKAKEESARSTRYGAPLALLMLDIDRFKRINDTYGHSAGDEVLKEFTSTVSKQLRQTDLLCRIGGEEFAVLLPNTDAKAAEQLGERLRQDISEIAIQSGGKTITFTASIGGTCLATAPDYAEAMLKRADTALYEAKRGGRNLVRMKLHESKP